jgi:hypothetical protein
MNTDNAMEAKIPSDFSFPFHFMLIPNQKKRLFHQEKPIVLKIHNYELVFLKGGNDPANGPSPRKR